MTKRKTVFRLLLGLACSAAILWLGVACGEDIDPDYQCGTNSLTRANKTREVILKYKSLFKRQPNFSRAREEFLRDQYTGSRTEEWGILVTVDGEKVDQGTLPPEDRIPDELEGVPVQILSWQIAEKAPSFLSGHRPDATPKLSLALDVIKKNADLFKRHPFYQGVGNTIPKSGNVARDRMVGIELFVTEVVDQNTLPVQDRIPDCLEDVPVRITVRPE